ARVTIVPPQAGQALVMVEGDSPLWMKRLPVPADGVTLEIPISDDWRQHNLYVSAMVLRRGDDQKAITPKRSFGLIHLPLDRDDRKLAVEFDLPEKVLPGQQLDVLMRVSGTDGSATREKLYLTLAAVDVGVLSISNFVTPDPHLGFFGQRRYEVENRDIYQQVIEVSDAQKARLRFGGDADLARGGKEPQSEVQIVSLFSGLIEVHGGMATVPLNIPDFNGRLRLMALAFSVDHFGNGERELIVAAPVVTQIAMPRFLATGDSAILALDINNLSGESQTLDVELTADGPVELQSAPERITLADKEKLTLSYAIEAVGYRGQAQFDLTLSGEGIDAVERSWRLGVRPPYPALVKQKHQLLNTGEQFQLNSSDIQGVLVDTVDAFLSVSSHADMNLDRQLKNLLAYPYGCLEQTSSRAFPLTYATPANQQQFGIKGISEKKRIEMIEGGIERMASMQLLNGGFGLWSNKSSEEHWLTAFVADFLISAREMGIAVPAVMLDKTMNRLKQYVNRSGRFVDERWSKNSNHYTFSYKAYSAYVLSRVNQAPLGSMRILFDNQLEWAKSGLSQAQLGIALIKMGDEKRGMAAIDKALQNLPGERTYLGDYGSPIRDKALLMHLLIDNGIYKNRAIEMSYSLAAAIKTRHWFSTQERNAMFLAGISLELSQSGNWRARLMLNAAEQDLEQESNYRLNLDGDAIEAGLLLESFYDKPLFVRVDISGYGKERPEPVADGLSILRSWYTPEGELITPQTVKVGELFVIHLELRAEQRTPDALVVDMIPAGFELENQNLEHAFKLDAFKFDGKSFEQIKRHTAIKHQEYRDDRFVAAVDINRYGSAHLFYLIRAVTPGVYKVPATLVEDMYRPELRGIGDATETITVENVQY
ncbi:MAG: alpha-2-macroglobulin family protein, partial [Gammaproteobacteria bacterium]|nr:alpha-2-macroglobulin family protein [Gammaproteobacteria bacterium]